jgi:hypothetical protein
MSQASQIRQNSGPVQNGNKVTGTVGVEIGKATTCRKECAATINCASGLYRVITLRINYYNCV